MKCFLGDSRTCTNGHRLKEGNLEGFKGLIQYTHFCPHFTNENLKAQKIIPSNGLRRGI